jgi:hypothetical protein
MTTELLIPEHETLQRDLAPPVTSAPAHEPSHAASTTLILRATGIVLLVGIAVIHIVQLVPTFEGMAALGVAYLLLIAGAVVVGARLVKGHRNALHLWLPVAGLGTAVVMGYGFTRLFSTPLDRADVGNWSCELGLAALFVEVVLVAMALYAISLWWNDEQTVRARRATPRFFSYGVGVPELDESS